MTLSPSLEQGDLLRQGCRYAFHIPDLAATTERMRTDKILSRTTNRFQDRLAVSRVSFFFFLHHLLQLPSGPEPVPNKLVYYLLIS